MASDAFQNYLDQVPLMIGTVANHWNILEYNMGPLAAILMGTNLNIARITINALPAVGKRDYLYALIADEKWKECGIYGDLNKFVKEFDRLRDLRNDIVHGRWGYKFSNGELVPVWQILKGKAKPKEHLDHKDSQFIQTVLNDIKALQSSLAKLTRVAKRLSETI